MLVVKKFNNEIFWVVPLSTKQKPLNFYFNYTYPSGAPVAAVLAQLRLVTINRLRRDIYVLPPALLDEVRAQLRAFLSDVYKRQLHEPAVGASDLLRARTRLKAKDLISLLLGHFAGSR